MTTRWGVKRGKHVTQFGKDLASALKYWRVTHGSTLVYRASGTWGERDGKRTTRWLHFRGT